MVYTPSPLKSKSTPGNFSNLKRDGSKQAIIYGNKFVTIDATGTPVTSPVTVNTTATLVVPQNAMRCTLISVTNPIQISEDSTGSTFFTLPAGVPMTIDCANQQYIYLVAGSSTVVSFLFNSL